MSMFRGTLAFEAMCIYLLSLGSLVGYKEACQILNIKQYP
jgi:hypothetical protein